MSLIHYLYFVEITSTYPNSHIHQHTKHTPFVQNEKLIDYRINGERKCHQTTNGCKDIEIFGTDNGIKELHGEIKQ